MIQAKEYASSLPREMTHAGAPVEVIQQREEATSTDRPPLRINLLGAPQIRRGNQLITNFISDKARALFYFLVISGEPHTRSTLATLCWADMPEEQALRNLRRALHNLQQLFAPHLTVSRQMIVFQPEPPTAVAVDLWQMLDGFAGPPPAQAAALALAQGSLLESFTVADAPMFDEWLFEQRGALQAQVVAAAQQALRVPHLVPHQELAVLQQLVAHEPWQEERQRHLLELLARQGAHADALDQYAQLQRYLATELAIEPEPATILLAQRIQQAQHRSMHHLPHSTTALIGRTAELDRIHRLLMPVNRSGEQAERIQLITLTGPGGSGKTRLALAVAHAERNRFLDGVWWVSLADSNSAEEAALAVARAIGLDLHGTTAVVTQIIQAIQGWDLLLILDSGEQLLSSAFRVFVLQLLEASPALRLLLTSRERLHLQQEQVIALPGLHAAEEVAALFITHVRQVQPHFAPNASEGAAIQAIGRLVDGLPLALTLAATLVASHSCAAILSMLQHDLDPLAHTQPARPVRQQSLRAVFDHSWQLLTATEQRTFAALAHFPGAFTLEAAQAVTASPADATAAVLRTLVHKSLLQPDPSRVRYVLHETLRSYAGAKLQAEPAFAEAVMHAYNHYFIHFLQSHRTALLRAVPATIAAVTAEFVHVRTVWHWACTHQQDEILLGMLREISFYLDVTAHYSEGQALLQAALTSFDQIAQPLTLLQQFVHSGLLLGYSNVLERLGNYEAAHAAASQALRIGEVLEEDEPIHFALLLLGRIALAQGHFTDAVGWLTQGANFCAAHLLAEPQARTLLRLGEAHLACGDIPAATAAFQQAMTLATASQEERALLYCHLGLGACALAQRDIQAAQNHWQSALARAQRIHVPALLAEVQVRIAGGLLLAGVHDKAATLLQTALPHLANQTHSTLFATAVRHLAWLYSSQGRWVESELLLQRSTDLTQNAGSPPQIVATLLAWGHFLQGKGNQAEAHPLLLMVRTHPAGTWIEQQIAGTMLAATDSAVDGIISAASTTPAATLLAEHFDATAAHAADAILLPLLKPVDN